MCLYSSNIFHFYSISLIQALNKKLTTTDSTLRILQLIDSLDAGGAETMAVNFANGLADTVSFSGLIATRSEGPLRTTLSKEVEFKFLNKKSAFDLKAIRQLYLYCKRYRINAIHAHSTSIYMAILIKAINPSLKVIWHDHYGNSEFLGNRPTFMLQLALQFTDGAVAVNSKLEQWIKKSLKFSKTLNLPNFAVKKTEKPATTLHGIKESRIVCLANLREQKNHQLLVRVASILKTTHPSWSFHFVGKDFNDSISDNLKSSIRALEVQDSIFLYGTRDDIGNILNQSDIAVLASKSEGLPVALLEYGLYSKPTLATNVGEIGLVIQDGKNGYLARSENDDEFLEKLIALIEDPNRNFFGEVLNTTIVDDYSKEIILDKYLAWLKKL